MEDQQTTSLHTWLRISPFIRALHFHILSPFHLVTSLRTIIHFTWVSSRKYRLSSAVCTSAGLRSWTPFSIRFTISRSFSRWGLDWVNTPGLLSLWNLVAEDRLSLDGDFRVDRLLGSANRNKFGQCCKALTRYFVINIIAGLWVWTYSVSWSRIQKITEFWKCVG